MQKVFFQNALKQLKLSKILNLVTQIILWIIDIFPCCLSCQKYLRNWCLPHKIDSYLKLTNVLYTNQFYFRKNSNTSHPIIQFLDYVYLVLDSKHCTIAVYLDFSKTFDTVNHDILMSMLLHNVIRGVMQSWFKSYLSNRKQYVSIKNCSSSMSKITLGVPQESVLNPELFILYINDMYRSSNQMCLFVLLTIQQFLHQTVRLTMFMPLLIGNW